MDTSPMLREMCRDVLTDADIKAIAKARGFSKKEIATRALFENLFLAPIGVEGALQSLTAEESALLHRMKISKAPVDVAFFSRIYPKEYSTSYSQQYGQVFKRVKSSLIRKGVLLIWQASGFLEARQTIMERWRFSFPQEFEPFLPPLFPSAKKIKGSGRVRAEALRAKVEEISRPSPRDQSRPSTGDEWHIRDGTLFLGERPFSVARLKTWQRSTWESRIRAEMKKSKTKIPRDVSVSGTAEQALSQLGLGEWVSVDVLSQVMKIFSHSDLDGHLVCEAGWNSGQLAGLIVDGEEHYRLAPEEGETEALPPHGYLKTRGAGGVAVDLGSVPYPALDELNQLAFLEIAAGELLATPSVRKLGDTSAELRQSSLAVWLQENAPGFRDAFQKVASRWGKLILHENLLVARVKDLSLRVKIERGLGDPRVVRLSEEFLAFPAEALPEVAKILNQAGHVMKEVARDG